MTDAPLPDLVLYGRAECVLCTEARELIVAMLEERRGQGRATPPLVERDIDDDPAWQRAYFASIPVVELGAGRLDTVIGAAKLRRLLSDQLDGVPA
jgi:Glutaredoxin-like domain (DUF836)